MASGAALWVGPIQAKCPDRKRWNLQGSQIMRAEASLAIATMERFIGESQGRNEAAALLILDML